MASRGEGVFTPDQMAAQPGLYGAGAGARPEIHIHMEGIYVGDGPSLDILAYKIAFRLGYTTGR